MTMVFSGSPQQSIADWEDHIEELQAQTLLRICMFCNEDPCICWVTENYCMLCRMPKPCLCIVDNYWYDDMYMERHYGTPQGF